MSPNSDYLGSATFLTGHEGLPYQFFLNLPFGESMAEQRSYTGSFDNRWKFTGKELDVETGLYYFGARFYNPSTSIWLSVDPLAELMPSFGGYTYNFNNPIMFTDPTGMMPEPPSEGIYENGYKHEDSDGSWTYNHGVWWDNTGVGNDIFHGVQQLEAVILSQPTIISRSKWGANSPITNGRDYTNINIPLDDYYDSIAIHHSGNINSPTINEIQQKHQFGPAQKADIGYHFAIDSKGNIYEGRPINIVGSHMAEANSNVIGIVLLGDYHQELIGNSDKLTKKTLKSLTNLIGFLHIKYGITKGINGHNGFNCGGYTECPGNKVEPWIPIIAKKLKLPIANCKTTGGRNLNPVTH